MDALRIPRGRVASSPALHGLTVLVLYAGFYLALFSSVLISDRLLAPGDGLIQNLPNFMAGSRSWTPLLYAGHPAQGDPQIMAWYPLRNLFRLLGSWNGFVVSAYVFAASFAYGFAYSLTRSRLAAFAGGLVYGTGGFLI